MTRMKVKHVERNDSIGQREATMIVTNDAVTFLQEAVDLYIQHNFGDTNDFRKQAIIKEVREDLIIAHNLLNPS